MKRNNFPFSDHFDLLLETAQLKPWGKSRSLELMFITPSERTLHAIIE